MRMRRLRVFRISAGRVGECGEWQSVPTGVRRFGAIGMKSEAEVILGCVVKDRFPRVVQQSWIANMKNIAIVEEFFTQQRDSSLPFINTCRDDGNSGVALCDDNKGGLFIRENLRGQSIPFKTLKDGVSGSFRDTFP